VTIVDDYTFSVSRGVDRSVTSRRDRIKIVDDVSIIVTTHYYFRNYSLSNLTIVELVCVDQRFVDDVVDDVDTPLIVVVTTVAIALNRRRCRRRCRYSIDCCRNDGGHCSESSTIVQALRQAF